MIVCVIERELPPTSSSFAVTALGPQTDMTTNSARDRSSPNNGHEAHKAARLLRARFRHSALQQIRDGSALNFKVPVSNQRHAILIRGRTNVFVSLFQMRRQHIFDPFHECADSARQIAPMCYDEGHGECPATKIGHDLHKRSALQVSANPHEWRLD